MNSITEVLHRGFLPLLLRVKNLEIENTGGEGEVRNNGIALSTRPSVNHSIEIIIPVRSSRAVIAVRDGGVANHNRGDLVEPIRRNRPSAKSISIKTGLPMAKNGAHFTNSLFFGERFNAVDEVFLGHMSLLSEESKRALTKREIALKSANDCLELLINDVIRHSEPHKEK